MKDLIFIVSTGAAFGAAIVIVFVAVGIGAKLFSLIQGVAF